MEGGGLEVPSVCVRPTVVEKIQSGGSFEILPRSFSKVPI